MAMARLRIGRAMALAALAAASVIVGLVTPAAARQDDLADRIAGALDSMFVPLANGFVESLDCPIRKADWRQPFTHQALSLVRDPTRPPRSAVPARMVVSWYYSGVEAILQANGDDLAVFAECFDGRRACGLERDNRLAKALARSPNQRSSGDERAIRRAFAERPPASVIAFTAGGLGRCFGDDPAQPSMEAMGFINVQGDPQACTMIGDFSTRGYEAWHDFYRVDERCQVGLWVPSSLPAAVNAAQVAAQARAEAWANRSVAERIEGLTGCQIAYSLVFRGVNGSSVGAVPDEAIGWALEYEQANLWGRICPPMPQALSNWVQQQDLARFERVEDPFDILVRRGPSTSDYYGWLAYLGPVLHRYETPADPHITIPDELCDDFRSWIAAGFTSKYDDPRPVRRVFFRNGAQVGGDKGRAFCQFVPRSMFADYQRERSVEAAELAEAERLYAIRERQRLEYDAELNAARSNRATSYLWENRSYERRCYQTGAQQMTCFSDR